MSNELTLTEDRYALMPVMDITQAGNRRAQIVQFAKSIMIENTDFGTIPGTTKPTLYKPGAEKLTTFFGLSKRFEIIERVEDWTGQQHGGEPFFYYLYRCALYKGDTLIAEADGSCNSFESKYRWRKSERKCPNCGAENIRKSKQGGGWYCWQKTGGCGATFKDGDQAIEAQETGRVANPDVCDQVNTIQKMAQKRALVAATLLAVNASEFFTQDLEDYVDVTAAEVVDQPAPSATPPRRQRENTPQQQPTNGAPKKSRLTIGQHKFYDAVQDATSNYYNDPAHLANAVGWPNFSSQDDIDERLSAAVDHANQRRDEPAVEEAA